jgi:hypothetical protein
MNKIQKSKSRRRRALPLKVLDIGYWNLSFVCDLVLGICIFRHKAPRKSHYF